MAVSGVLEGAIGAGGVVCAVVGAGVAKTESGFDGMTTTGACKGDSDCDGMAL